nr:C1 family peptidase [uncultured Peptostreptococcus sp.]
MDLSRKLTDVFEDEFIKDSKKLLAQCAVHKNGIQASCESFDVKIRVRPVFSIDLDTGKVTDQKRSGRCWMFAALNTFRHKITEKFNIEDFELSQNYVFFWDKYEKANFFHENILATADRPLDDRRVAFLLKEPQQDGGQWDMIVSIFQKYGVVPKDVMPEVHASSNSAELNKYLNKKLRKDAMILRKLVLNEASDEEIIEARRVMMKEVFDVLAISLGNPSKSFNFEYRDKNNNYHIDKDLSPQEFYNRYVGVDLNEYVSVINAPTEDKPYMKSYTVEMLGNVVGGRQVKYLNVDMKNFKRLALAQLSDGEPIWFGCDVGQFSSNQSGIMDLQTYQPGDLFDVDFNTSKADRLEYGESLMTHAMVLTGVDLVDGEPTRWKVENSWGDKVGHKGYYVMTDEWMDQYTYQIVVRKEFLTDQEKEAFDSEPVILSPWDPMGSLA